MLYDFSLESLLIHVSPSPSFCFVAASPPKPAQEEEMPNDSLQKHVILLVLVTVNAWMGITFIQPMEIWCFPTLMCVNMLPLLCMKMICVSLTTFSY